MKKIKSVIIVGLLAGAAVLIPCAQAQSAHNASTAAKSANLSPDANGLADIIVTAQRQSENVQRAAIAISVLQPEALVQVTNPESLTKLAPALQIGNASGATPLLYIRGVGTFATNPYSDSAVAVNYDGVYLGRPSSTYGLFYDLDRIEVLKGPQGTLYGRNATGGALNILPAHPVIGAASMLATISAGNYDAVNAQAAANVPLSDIAALRFAGTTYTHEGYNSDGTFSERGTGGRVQLLVEPSPDFSFRIAGDYFDLGGTGSTGILLSTTNPATGATIPVGLGSNVGLYDPRASAVLNSTFVSLAGTTNGALPAKPYINNQYYGISGEINADLGFGKLTLVGSWRRSDIDNIALPTSFLTQSIETDKQHSAEVRLAGKVGPLDWLVGGYYYNEDVDASFLVNYNILGSTQIFKATNTSYAGFGRLNWHLTDKLRITGAARYTQDRKRFDGFADVALAICTGPTHVCPNVRRLPADILNLPGALASIGYIQPPGVPVYIDATGTSNAIYSPSRTTVNGSTSPNKLTYRIATEFEPRDGSLLYASYETGYRSGGFSFSSIKPVYAPENIGAYTLGTKNRFFDNKLQLNIEGFLWKYKDQQVSHQTFGATGGLEFVTENIGQSTNKGVEVEVMVKPLQNTLLRADVQYLDAKNGQFVFSDVDTSLIAGLPPGTIPPATNCPATSVLATGNLRIDCSGLRALRSPKWTINLGIQQTIPLSDGFDLSIEGNAHYQSSGVVMFERRDYSVQSAYWMSDAAITLSGGNKTWSIAAFVNNIENRRTPTNTFFNSINGVTTGNFSPPRTYGGRLLFHF